MEKRKRAIAKGRDLDMASWKVGEEVYIWYQPIFHSSNLPALQFSIPPILHAPTASLPPPLALESEESYRPD